MSHYLTTQKRLPQIGIESTSVYNQVVGPSTTKVRPTQPSPCNTTAFNYVPLLQTNHFMVCSEQRVHRFKEFCQYST